MQATAEINYIQQQDTGRLTLSGIIDIFEAERLQSAARQALENADARALQVDMGGVERLDVSAAQILMALKTGAAENNQTFRVQAVSPSVEKALKTLGVIL